MNLLGITLLLAWSTAEGYVVHGRQGLQCYNTLSRRCMATLHRSAASGGDEDLNELVVAARHGDVATMERVLTEDQGALNSRSSCSKPTQMDGATGEWVCPSRHQSAAPTTPPTRHADSSGGELRDHRLCRRTMHRRMCARARAHATQRTQHTQHTQHTQPTRATHAALIWASRMGFDQAVSLLLKKDGVDVDAATASGWTALYAAAMNGEEECVEALLLAGANIEAAMAMDDEFTNVKLLRMVEEAGIDRSPRVGGKGHMAPTRAAAPGGGRARTRPQTHHARRTTTHHARRKRQGLVSFFIRIPSYSHP